MADGGGLLNRCAGETRYRGFESLPLRCITMKDPVGVRVNVSGETSSFSDRLCFASHITPSTLHMTQAWRR